MDDTFPRWLRLLVEEVVADGAGFDAVHRIFTFVRDGVALEVEIPDLPLTLARTAIAAAERRATPGQKAVLFVSMMRVARISARFGVADLEDLSLGRRAVRRHLLASYSLDGSWSRCDLLLSERAARRLRATPRELRPREDCLLPRASDDGVALFRYRRFHGEFEELPFELFRTRGE